MVKYILMIVIECTTDDQRINMKMVFDSLSTDQLPTVSWYAKSFR